MIWVWLNENLKECQFFNSLSTTFFLFLPRLQTNRLLSVNKSVNSSVIEDSVIGSWGELAFWVAWVFGWHNEATNCDLIAIVRPNGAHVLKSEKDIDLCILQLLVDVRKVVLHMLICKLDMVVFWCRTHNSLVPNSDTVLRACLCTELTDQRHEQSVRIPIDQRFQIHIHVKWECKGFFFVVAIGKELVNLTNIKFDGVLR